MKKSIKKIGHPLKTVKKSSGRPSWVHSGANLGDFGANLGQLGASGRHLGANLAEFGAKLAQLGPTWVPSSLQDASRRAEKGGEMGLKR